MATFPDVPPDHWAYHFIDVVTDEGLMNGYPDGMFRPERATERDELATVVYNLLGYLGLLDPDIPDTTPPIIVLNDPTTMYLTQGDLYLEPGWTVVDDTDPDPSVVVIGEVDTSIPGVYTLTYNASDASGNTSTTIRTVIVKAPQPPPVDDFDVILEPGDDLQAKVDAAGEGAKIGIAPGAYENAGVKARAGQLLEVADRDEDVVWNGHGRSYGLQGNGIEAVIVRGHGKWRLHNYRPGLYKGVIDTFAPGNWFGNPLYLDQGWEVDGLLIHDSIYAAVTLADHNARLTNCKFWDIGTLGFSMRFGHDMYVGQLEMRHIGHQNQHGTWGKEGGGSKSWDTHRLVHEDIDVEDVIGPGVWCDHDNHDTVYRRIYARNTSAAAIFHEISGWCDIEQCVIEDQPRSGGDIIWSRGGAAITIANAKARITDTRITNCETGIAYLDQSRGGWTDTTEGEVWECLLDNAGKSGSGNDHGGPKPPVTWTDVVKRNGSSID